MKHGRAFDTSTPRTQHVLVHIHTHTHIHTHSLTLGASYLLNTAILYAPYMLDLFTAAALSCFTCLLPVLSCFTCLLQLQTDIAIAYYIDTHKHTHTRLKSLERDRLDYQTVIAKVKKPDATPRVNAHRQTRHDRALKRSVWEGQPRTEF